MKLLLFITILFISINLYARSEKFLKYHGYMRAGTGQNSLNGDQVCFKNGGTPGNEFRLGNECAVFGDVIFRGNHVLADTENDKYFYSQFRFTFEENGHTQWEGTGVKIREVYFEGGRFNDSPLSYWAGKRFYRENDVWMNDFYYFADMSGTGGGIGNIPMGLGVLHLAYLREVGAPENITTSDIGTHGINMYDARLKDIKIDGLGKFMIWVGYATASKGTDYTTYPVTKYDSSKGLVAGFLHEYNFDGGFNHFAVLGGQGLLDEFSLGGNNALVKNSTEHREQKDSNRYRFVEHLTFKPMNQLEMHLSSTLELRDSGATSKSKEHWYNFGISPVWFFTDHYQLAFQAGYSVVDADGSPKRTMTRVTIAPQVSPGGIWGRPVIRAFYSKTFWNRNNRGVIDSWGPYKGETSGSNFGLQGELWF